MRARPYLGRAMQILYLLASLRAPREINDRACCVSTTSVFSLMDPACSPAWALASRLRLTLIMSIVLVHLASARAGIRRRSLLFICSERGGGAGSGAGCDCDGDDDANSRRPEPRIFCRIRPRCRRWPTRQRSQVTGCHLHESMVK